eukprot:9169-Pyramimonas_sp.AAC.1
MANASQSSSQTRPNKCAASTPRTPARRVPPSKLRWEAAGPVRTQPSSAGKRRRKLGPRTWPKCPAGWPSPALAGP